MDSENTIPHFSDWIETVNKLNKEKREKRVRQYLVNHPSLEIPNEDAYFRLVESLDHERYWE